MLKSKNRGQVSIFFIIAIAIIIILTISIFIMNRVYRLEDNVMIPAQLMPARNFISYCMDRSSTEAFYILGRQGGYINVPPELGMTPGRSIVLGNGAEVLPFWYYENANWVPRIEFMENELSTYINEKFKDCIAETDLLQPGFSIRTLSQKSETRVVIGQENVKVEIEYPIEISFIRNDIKTKIRKFSEEYNVRIFDMWELAKYLLVYENTYMILENMTIDLMAMNPTIPFTGLIPECGVRTWYISDIKSDLQNLVSTTFPEIKVKGTRYIPFEREEDAYDDSKKYSADLRKEIEEIEFNPLGEPADYEEKIEQVFNKYSHHFDNLPLDKYFYFNSFIPIQESDLDKFADFSVDFQHQPDFGMDIQAKPSSDGILKSNSAKGARKYLSFFCINSYHFTYDINFPVIITITDDMALNKGGYQFRFAIPVMIRNNEGDRSKQSMDFLPFRAVPDDFCKHDIGRNVMIKTYDVSVPGDQTIEDVDLSLICVMKKCNLGKTKRTVSTAYLDADITTACGNPYIFAEKPGYHDAFYLLEDDDEDLIEIDMVRLKNFTVNLVKHNYYPADKRVGAGGLIADGTVHIHLTGLVKGATYEETFILDPSKENKILLPVADAEYDLSITYFKNDEDFSGGYFDEWKVNGMKLASSNMITFHLVEMILSALDEDAAASVDALHGLSSDELRPSVQ
jgi:hypothetical protein